MATSFTYSFSGENQKAIYRIQDFARILSKQEGRKVSQGEIICRAVEFWAAAIGLTSDADSPTL